MPGTHFRLTILASIAYALSVWSNASCPTGLSDAGDNICVLKIQKSVDFCQAHETCEQEGSKRGLRLFVPGLHVNQISQHFSRSMIFTTSVTAFLNRSSALRAGFRVGDPGYADFTTEAGDRSIPWTRGEPNYHKEAIGKYRRTLFEDESQPAVKAPTVICELSTRSIDGTTERFKMDWPYPLRSKFLVDTGARGCFQSMKVASPLACAYRCKLLPACRSFYFNEAVGNCWLALYVDSLLPNHLSSESGDWLRFGRPDW